ncbi:hypothetical protein [Croceicoccus mobilis]|uniref:Uncharacterized protein n=1 Tax=Croceicoccus mobilis TaxID=1703339 RepID=A0A917DV38_9SPHN|nr:hypothetical protein [Croceicoccus mobilis]GGD74002.1 hypothetical protein GCM10010990_24530 [Croceicoccus mobilis]
MSDPIRDALASPVVAPVMAQEGEAVELAKRERPPFPPGCPVRPLGISSNIGGSQLCFYLDYNGQLVGLEAGNRHGKNSLIALFGPASDWLEASFPQWSAPKFEGRGKDRKQVAPPEIVGFDQAEASRAMIEECARKGIFDPAGRMRGRGAHRHEANGLVIHYGDKILASKHTAKGEISGWTWYDAGLFQRHVYQAATPIPRPWHEDVDSEPGEKLLGLLNRWHWRRKLMDPVFLLGWIGAAMLGGALDWRPNIWITGGRGTGKSSINGDDQIIHQLLGDAQFRTAEASSAAIRQSLQNSTVPVIFDEIEAEADNRRVNEVIKLARISSSGGKAHRGSQDHNAKEFTLASCFMFSSILIPPLPAQDRSRLGILELQPFKQGAEPPVLANYGLPELGRKLQRRMIDGWPILMETRARFQAALSMAGHDARACMQFGTLMACAYRLLNDGLPDDEAVNAWVDKSRPDRMAEISEAESEQAMCLAHVLTSPVQARGGEEREALSHWVALAVNELMVPLDAFAEGVGKYDKRLQQMGLKLVNASWHPDERDFAGKVVKPGRWGTSMASKEDPIFLAVAAKHRGLDALFQNTKWAGGVWRQALERFEPEGAIDGPKVKFSHSSQRAVLVPLHVVLDEDELPAESKRDAVLKWREKQKSGEAE